MDAGWSWGGGVGSVPFDLVGGEALDDFSDG